MRTYTELSKLRTFDARFRYLALHGAVGRETFGFDRYLNQTFYRSAEWKCVRDKVILRDGGCDLGMPGYEISGRIYIHHMNPIRSEAILDRSELLLDPELLVCVSFDTHNAIHYGDESLLPEEPVTRTAFDTCPWRKAR